MNELTADSGPTPNWNQLRPVIDEALHRLSERDQEAVLLRFFEGKPFAEVGAALAISENTARVRVDRALDKLRIQLSKRGVTSTSAALATLLANQAFASAPAGLALSVSGAALGAAAATGGATALATFMGLTKVQVAAAALAVAGGTVLVQQRGVQEEVRTEIAGLRQQQAEAINLRERRATLAPPTPDTTSIQDELTDLSKLRAELKVLQEKKDEADSYKATLAQKAKQREESRRTASLNKNLKPEELPFAPIFSPSDLDVRPKPLSMSEPILSTDLIAASKEKALKATAYLIIDTTGRPQNITVTNSTSPAFAAAVEKAVSRWFFSPGLVNGKPVASRLSIPFVMNKK